MHNIHDGGLRAGMAIAIHRGNGTEARTCHMLRHAKGSYEGTVHHEVTHFYIIIYFCNCTLMYE